MNHNRLGRAEKRFTGSWSGLSVIIFVKSLVCTSGFKIPCHDVSCHLYMGSTAAGLDPRLRNGVQKSTEKEDYVFFQVCTPERADNCS